MGNCSSSGPSSGPSFSIATEDDVDALIAALSNGLPAMRLILPSSWMGGLQCKANLTNAIRNNTSIKSLAIIQPSSAEPDITFELRTAIAYNTSITSLSWHRDGRSKEAAEYTMTNQFWNQVVNENTSITRLAIGGGIKSDTELVRIIGYILDGSGSGIVDIDITGNALGEAAAKKLISLLTDNPTIKSLKVDDEKLQAEIVKLLPAAISASEVKPVVT